ncbi:MAG: MmgE/PrpD family protein [Proteobacteria bacterium]|nr:MmgE/PrpD family protein [Pseudomonadota bacterium]
MEPLLHHLSDYAVRSQDQAVNPVVSGAMVDHLVDALGCAVAGLDETASRIARDMAAEFSTVGMGASVIGLKQRVSPEQAAFANAVMVRGLDFNDTFNSRTGGHPSDMVPAILAAAETANVAGESAVRGMIVAYEVFGAFADVVPLRELGIDQGVIIGAGVAAGIASTLELDSQQTANAISLAITSTVPLRVARSGELSAWKGGATPHAAMNGLFVTRLAARGMTGPPAPFSGADGFFDRVGFSFDLPGLGRPVNGQSVVERTSIKFRPVEWCAQAPIELILELRKSLDLVEIESIVIAGYDFLVREIGGGRDDAAQKWDPQTRETADHSLPYLIAVALVDGEVTLDSFALDRVRDPALRPIMNKIQIFEAPATRDLPPTRQPVTVKITMRNGHVIEEGCEYPVGHPLNPPDIEAVDEKFKRLCAGKLDSVQTAEINTVIREIEAAPDLSALTAAFRAISTS